MDSGAKHQPRDIMTLWRCATLGMCGMRRIRDVRSTATVGPVPHILGRTSFPHARLMDREHGLNCVLLLFFIFFFLDKI
jgi:hypothetical protein